MIAPHPPCVIAAKRDPTRRMRQLRNGSRVFARDDTRWGSAGSCRCQRTNGTRSSAIAQPHQSLAPDLGKVIPAPSGGRILQPIPSRLRGRDERSAGGGRCGAGVDPHQVDPAGNHGRVKPCVQGPEIAPRVLPPEGLGGRGQVKPDASTGSPRAAVKWLVEGRTGHKPRSCGEALVLTTRRLPAPGSEPRHAAIPCGTAYPHNRAAGR